MKTTIEIHGFEIVIDETEQGVITVSALKDGETVEEFELEGGEDHPGFEDEEGEEELHAFGEEEEDFGQSQEEEEEEEEGEEAQEEEEFEEEEEEGKLESFNSFIRKRK